jgi:hypothetical protein
MDARTHAHDLEDKRPSQESLLIHFAIHFATTARCSTLQTSSLSVRIPKWLDLHSHYCQTVAALCNL